MVNFRTSANKKKNSIIKLKIVVEKLQKSLLRGKKPASNSDEFEDVNDSMNVPQDVKEGHFAVMAVDDDELKRFIVPLSFLTNPSFSRMLEQAAEEYGFDHEGALTFPCRPSELERILAEDRESRVAVNWGFSKTLVKSC
ncbi:protein SMALL AUXIN UP-REGULATED RNA 51-like [Cornus florida]|uniref:protein SMALL AUXIN UP-REGULATED RNA 51-like n=1 Tax=Cornus florida TaxID=4283 RepID=UPI0028A1EB7D|nr:protein SMALL AUXIN UP-REGULATED RNA 51-like [Cornus florida]